MSTLLDDRIGMKKETTYGTPVVVDRFYPHLDDVDTQWDPRIRQGMGLQGGSGRISPLASRNFAVQGQGNPTVKAELESKQAGVLLEAVFGSATVTAVTGGAFMLFHPGISGTRLPSYTIQHVKVLNDGTEWVETYSGCTASKATIEQPKDDITTIEVEFDALSLLTVTAAATQTYAASTVLYDTYRVSGVGLGGSLTVPTTTAFATGLTANTAFREYKIEIDHQIDDSDWKLGTRGQPTVGIPKIQFAGKADFDATTLPAALIAGTKLKWYCTYTTGVTDELAAGVSGGFQVVIPNMVLSKELPKVKAGETRVMGVTAKIVNDGTNRDLYACYRTVDTTL